VIEHGPKALGHGLAEHGVVKLPDGVILVGIVTHPGGFFRVLTEIGFDLCFALGVCIE
jgi:hypothetical protein